MRLSDIQNSTAQTTEAPVTAPVSTTGMRLSDVEQFPDVRVDGPEFKDGVFTVPDEQIKAWEAKGKIGWFEQAKRIDKTEMLPFWGGAESIAGSVELLNTVNRIKENNYGADEFQRQNDTERLVNYLTTLEEQRVRGVTVPGKIVEGMSQVPAFILEFVATGGLATLGKTAVKKGATVALRAGVDSGITKLAARVAAPLAETAVRTAATPMGAASAAERMVRANLTLTDKGTEILEQANETPFTSILKGYGDAFIENYSEISGGWIAKAGGALVPVKIAKSFEKVFKRLHPDKAVRELWTKAGFHGFLSEVGEERLGDFLRAVTGVEDFGADDPSSILDRVVASIPHGEDLLVELGVLGITSLGFHGTSRLMQKIRAERKEAIADNTQEISNEDVEEIVSAVELENATSETKTGTTATKKPKADAIKTEANAAVGKIVPTEPVELPPLPEKDAQDILIQEGRIAQLSEESDQILTEIDSLEEQKILLEKQGRSTKAIDAKQAKLAQEFDYIDSVIGNLMTDIEPKIKLRDKILTTVGKTLNTIATKVKEGVNLSKNEIAEAQTDLVKYLEASPLEIEDRAKFLRTVKNIQSYEDLAKSLPAILDRVEKLQEASTKRKTAGKIRSILKKSKPKSSGGKPVGKFTADVQQILDRARKAMDMPRIEAELKISENLAQATEEGLSPELILDNWVLNSFSDIDSRSADELAQRLKELQDLTKTGRNIASIKIKARQERATLFAEKALEVIQGSNPVTAADKPKKKMVQAVSQALRTLGKSMSGWDDLLNVFSQDSKSKSFSSWLNENLSTIKVETAEKAAVQKWGDTFRNLAMKKLGFKSESRFFKWLHDSEQEVDLGEFVDADKKPVRLVLSRSVARKIWMDMQQEDLKATIFSGEGGYRIGSREINGITPEMEKAIKTFLTPEDIEFAKAQIDFYRQYYPRVNARFREDFGVDLPFNKNYSPIRRETTKKEIVSSVLDEREFRRSMLPGALKSRVKNREKIVGQSDIGVLMKHVIEMEHYLNWGDKIRDIQAVFGDSRVKNVIRAKFGEAALKNVNEFVTDFIRNGGEKARLYDKRVNNFIGNFTISVLGVKPAMTLKQMSSFMAFVDAVPAKDFIGGLAHFMSDPIKASTILMNTDFMKVRSDNITRDIQDGLNSREFNMFRKSPTFKNAMLFFAKYGDRFAIILGGWPVYRYHFEKTGDHQKAVEEFTKFATRTQQSSYLSQLSSWQRGNSLQRLFTLFTSAQNQYLRQEIAAVRDGLKGRLTPVQMAKKLAIYHLILPNLFQYIANFGHWDEEEQVRASILGSLNGIFILNDILDMVVRTSLNQFADFDLETYGGSLPFEQIKRGIVKSIGELTDEEISLEDIVSALGELAANVGGPLTGLPVRQILNSYEGVTDIVEEGELRKGVLKLGGWSPRLVNKYLGEEE